MRPLKGQQERKALKWGLSIALAIVILLTFSGFASAGLGSVIIDLFWKAVDFIIAGILALVTGFVGIIIPLLTSPTVVMPRVNEGRFLFLAGVIMKVIIPLVMFVILYTAIKLIFTSPSPNERAAAKSQLQSLLVALVLIPVSPHLYQMVLRINYQLTMDLLGGTIQICSPTTGCFPHVIHGVYEEVVGGTNFGSALLASFSGVGLKYCFVLGCAYILTILAIALIFTRHMMVIILGVLMPLSVFLYFFEFTKGVGKKFIKQAIAWAFVPTIMAVWVIAAAVLLVNVGSGVDPSAGMFMSIAFLGMIFMSPLIITGALELMGSVVASAGQLSGGGTGVLLTAAGQLMKAKSPEGLITAGAMMAASTMTKGLAKGGRKAFSVVKNDLKKGPGNSRIMKAVGGAGKLASAAVGKMGGATGKKAMEVAGKVKNSKFGQMTGKAAMGAVRGAAAVGRFIGSPGKSLMSAGGKLWAGGGALGKTAGASLMVAGAGLRAGYGVAKFGAIAAYKSAMGAAWVAKKGASLSRATVGLAADGIHKARRFGKSLKVGALDAMGYNNRRRLGAVLAFPGQVRYAGRWLKVKAKRKMGRHGRKIAGEILGGARPALAVAGALLGKVSELGSEGGAADGSAKASSTLFKQSRAGKGAVGGWFANTKIGKKMKAFRAGGGLPGKHPDAWYSRLGRRLGRGRAAVLSPFKRAGRGIGSAYSWTKALPGRLSDKIGGSRLGTVIGENFNARVAAADDYLSKSAFGSGLAAYFTHIAAMSIGQGIGAVAKTGLIIGAMSTLVGTAAIGGTAVPGALSAGMYLYMANKMAQSSGLGHGIGSALRSTPWGFGFMMAMTTYGVKKSGKAFRGLNHKGYRAGFIAGKVVGVGLDLGGYLAFRLPVVMAMKGVAYAATGGLSLYKDIGGLAIKTPGAIKTGIGAVRDARGALKGTSSKGTIGMMEDFSPESRAKFEAAFSSAGEIADAGARMDGSESPEARAKADYEADPAHKKGDWAKLGDSEQGRLKQRLLLSQASKNIEREKAANTPEARARAKYDALHKPGDFDKQSATKQRLLTNQEAKNTPAPKGVQFGRDDFIRDARYRYDRQPGNKPGSFDALGATKEGRVKQERLIRNQEKNWKSQATESALKAEKSQNPFYQSKNDATRIFAAANSQKGANYDGMSIESASKLVDGGGMNLEKMANQSGERTAAMGEALGIKDEVNIDTAGHMQKGAAETRSALFGGVAQSNPASGKGGGAMGATGESATGAESTGNTREEQAAMRQAKQAEEQGHQNKILELKQAMLYGGRHRPSKGTSDQLEEMLEDRDETPSR